MIGTASRRSAGELHAVGLALVVLAHGVAGTELVGPRTGAALRVGSVLAALPATRGIVTQRSWRWPLSS